MSFFHPQYLLLTNLESSVTFLCGRKTNEEVSHLMKKQIYYTFNYADALPAF